MVDDFVAPINKNSEILLTPADEISVDESMSRWFGLGCDWIGAEISPYRIIDGNI